MSQISKVIFSEAINISKFQLRWCKKALNLDPLDLFIREQHRRIEALSDGNDFFPGFYKNFEQ